MIVSTYTAVSLTQLTHMSTYTAVSLTQLTHMSTYTAVSLTHSSVTNTCKMLYAITEEKFPKTYFFGMETI